MNCYVYKNEISENQEGVVVISSENKLMMNKIIKNSENGVYVLTIDDILNDSEVKLNLISQNTKHGVLLEGLNNFAIVQSNYNISENGQCGICVSDSAEVRITNNFIYYNKGQGILLQESTIAKVHLNNIFKNFKANLALGGENSGDHLITKNVIHGSCSEGIYIIKGGCMTINKNEVFNNYDGIVIENSCPELKSNKIRNRNFSHNRDNNVYD